MTLESSKNLGGIGAILILVGTLGIFALPYLLVIALVGIIMILIALHGFADYYKEQKIFSNALFGFIAEIVGTVTAIVTLLYIIFDTTIFTSFLHKIYPGWNGSWSSLSGMTLNTTGLGASDVTSIIGALLVVGIIFWIFTIVASVLNWRSLKALSAKANVGLFSTAAMILIIGAVLTIILIGFIIMWIGVLVLTIAFFQIKPQEAQPPPMMTAGPPPPTPV